MRTVLATLLAAGVTLLACCGAMTDKDKSDREWKRAECNRVIDQEARERCLKNL